HPGGGRGRLWRRLTRLRQRLPSRGRGGLSARRKAPGKKTGAGRRGQRPAGSTGQALTPFSDVVPAALRVQPIPATLAAPAPAPLTGRPLPKVDAMRRVATKLHRDKWLFLPPFAIDFDKCVMCAECIAGCQFHAKNTLDLNYLAVAEAAPGVDVRTLAEVARLNQEGGGTHKPTHAHPHHH